MLNNHSLRRRRRLGQFDYNSLPYTPDPPVNNNWLSMALILAGIVSLLLFLLGGCAQAQTLPLPSRPYSASWYGVTGDTCDPWKHTRTASGEVFNENAMTGASWGFKFGTLLKVTNLGNGKSCIIKINDRGPGRRLYRKGRVLDLTRGSFQKIAKLSDGVIKIKIEVIK